MFWDLSIHHHLSSIGIAEGVARTQTDHSPMRRDLQELLDLLLVVMGF